MSLEVVCFLTAEIVLIAAALVIYLGGAFSQSQKVWAPIALGSIVLASVALWYSDQSQWYFGSHEAAQPFRGRSRFS